MHRIGSRTDVQTRVILEQCSCPGHRCNRGVTDAIMAESVLYGTFAIYFRGVRGTAQLLGQWRAV
jgi:hypothetical protein